MSGARFLHPRNEAPKSAHFIFILTCRCMEIHGNVAVLFPMDLLAGTKPWPARSGIHSNVVELGYSSVT